MQFKPALTQSNVNENMYNAAFQFDKGNISLPLRQNNQTPIGSETQNQSILQRPPSQATSVKADMGSTSASVVNRVSLNLINLIFFNFNEFFYRHFQNPPRKVVKLTHPQMHPPKLIFVTMIR